MTASFLDWLTGWVKASSTHFGIFAVTTLAAYLSLLVVLGWLGWHYAPARLKARVTSRLFRLHWPASTSTRTHPYAWPKPPVDDVVAGCWLDVAEDQPLPIALDPQQALNEAYALASAGPMPQRVPQHVPSEALPGAEAAWIEQGLLDLEWSSDLEFRRGRGGAS